MAPDTMSLCFAGKGGSSVRFSIDFVCNNSEQGACLDLKGKRAYALGGLVIAPLDRFCAQEGNGRRVNAAAGFAVGAIRGGHVVQGSG